MSSGAISVSKGNVNSQNTQLRRKKTQWNKLDLASGEIVPKINGPATAFLPFRKLPTELGLKIWGNAARHPRFIEIEYGPKERDSEDLGSVICAGEHYRHRVAPRSRLPPAIFHVCNEARNEAEKIYQLRTFDTMTPNRSERYIYYNPQCDIIYFGDDTCVSNMVSVFYQQPRLPIPRVAINLPAEGLQCCDWDDYTYGVDDGLTVMRALHGIFPPVSNLWHLDQGKIDATVSMRHAITNGLTKGQRSFKKDTLWSMKCVKDGAWCAGTNLWTGTENEPKFHFISFAPHPRYDGTSTTYYDGLGVNTPAVQFLGHNNGAAVKKIEKSTGCVITVARQSFRNEEPRELGFTGVEKSIVDAKALVLEKLATFEKTIVTKVADAYEDEWLNIRQVREGEL